MDVARDADVEHIAAEARTPRLAALPAQTLERMLAEAEQQRDALGALLVGKGQAADQALAAGRWADWEELRLEIGDLHYRWAQARDAVTRLADDRQWRRLHDRAAERLGGEGGRRALEAVMLGLIAVVLGIMVCDVALPRLGWSVRVALVAVDTAVCLVFLGEFAWRMRLADSRWWYLRHHWLDLVSSLPVAPLALLGGGWAGLDLVRLARIVRVVRALRLLRLGRLSRAWRGLGSLFSGFDRIATTFRLHPVNRPLLLALGLLFGGGLLICRVEAARPGLEGAADGLWWSFGTVVTGNFTGAGEPVSGAGRVLAVLLVISGVILTSAITAGLAGVLLGDDTERIERAQTLLRRRVDELSRDLLRPVAGTDQTPQGDDPR